MVWRNVQRTNVSNIACGCFLQRLKYVGKVCTVSVMTMVLAAFGKMMKHDETVTVSSLEMHALCV